MEPVRAAAEPTVLDDAALSAASGGGALLPSSEFSLALDVDEGTARAAQYRGRYTLRLAESTRLL